jgi:hypothetical protein
LRRSFRAMDYFRVYRIYIFIYIYISKCLRQPPPPCLTPAGDPAQGVKSWFVGPFFFQYTNSAIVSTIHNRRNHSNLIRTRLENRCKHFQKRVQFGPHLARNRPGDLVGTLWTRLGCPRGPRSSFGSEKLVRWTPPGRPDGGPFS